jgi:site-specific DNA recombinase
VRRRTIMPKRKAVVYARISADRGGERVGVNRQLKDCEELIARKGYILAHEPFVDNNVSAYSGKPRPAYRDMVKLVQSDGIGAIVVWHIDRLYRSPRELEDLIDLVEGKGMVVDPVTTDSTIDLSSSDGILVARIGVAVARKSSDDTRRRVKAAKTQAKAEGRWLGGGRRPYGYVAVDKPGELRRFNFDPAEAKIVRDIARRIIQGDSMHRVAVDLNERGIPTAGGARWRPGAIKRLLFRDLPAATFKPILTDDETRILKARLNDKAKLGRPPGPRAHPLTGLVICGGKKCGAKMVGSGGRNSEGYFYTLYRCLSQQGGCGKVSVGATRLEEFVRAALDEQGLLIPPDRSEPAPGPADEGILSKMRTLEERLVEVGGQLDIPVTALASQTQAIERGLAELRSQLAAVPREPQRDAAVPLLVEWLYGWVPPKGSEGEVLRLHDAIASVIAKITVVPAPRGADVKDRVEIEYR